MGDISDEYTDSNPDDWDYDYIDFCPDGFDRDVRRECAICHQMFVGPVADDPVCDDCFYQEDKRRQ